MFRITQKFGPMFKIMVEMMYELVKFLIIWVMILLTFACVSTLVFGNLDNFTDIQSAFVYYFFSSLGSFDVGAYDNRENQVCKTNQEQNIDDP